MKKTPETILAVALVSLVTACGDVSVTGPSPSPMGPSGLDLSRLPQSSASGDAVTETREVDGFSAVSISGVGFLYIEQTGFESLTISAEASVLPKLASEVRGGRLVLGAVPGSDLSTSVPIEYRLTVRELDEISVAGVVLVEAMGIDADRLRVRVEGLSRLTATGSADSQEIVIAGTNRYQAAELACRDARIDVTGAASGLLRVSDRLDARVSGSGLVEYYGDPVVTADVSGNGRVRRLGS